MKSLLSIEETKELIEQGKSLLIAAEEELIAKLPKGNWIAGTIPYFMGDDGGIMSKEVLQVTVLPEFSALNKIKAYSKEELSSIPKEYPENGASFIIIPAASEVHQEFANNCISYEGIFDRPLVGWISGVDLAELGKKTPKVISGVDLKSYENEALVMHLDLEEKYFAQVDIINLFEQSKGDVIQFEKVGFEVDECLVNGEKRNFFDYIKEKEINIESPLVANFSGAMVNVSFQALDEENKKVALYAPVFEGIEYKIANSVADYEKEFQAYLDEKNIVPAFSCNCILNYLYANLEGKKTGNIKGPITFGEIAYMLLNQTLVYLSFVEK
ncbi:hypothetical protein HBN50_08075 [Halobacteriovorax sp. GB3]|uniref:DUF6976 family protein n=1 Tax=Halobacteriovorax sp. GB3 TaxID=2719615 RepID=UPI00235F8794|nr:hypothetical protein [Halobacteriovorax sp. GB3]MDD0853049.1 hypothetical protein [Halobacteriovorax sp. GB3]